MYLPLALSADNETLYGVAALVVIIAGILYILGRFGR
jgi:hypothetical protein